MRSLTRRLIVAIGLASPHALSAQPRKPKLEMRTTTGQTTFHVGERISLTLTLTGPDDRKYAVDTATYDRSGRLEIDTFRVSPASGWSDPLAQYFLSLGGFFGGGLRGSELLSSKPISFVADLNEQVRFDKPGIYTINATSHRVGARGASLFPREPYLSLRSNPIRVHIIAATTAWQAEKLHSILTVLVTPPGQSDGPPDVEGPAAAIADLRFLNSPASIDLLASYLRDGPGLVNNHRMWAAALGLAGVPDNLREKALSAMGRQLDEPAFPVNDIFLQIMAALDASPQADFAEMQASRNERSLTVWRLALSGLRLKQGPARTATADVLLNHVPHGISAETTAQLATVVTETFTDLPIGNQGFDLENRWDDLKGQAMLPVFQALLHAKPTKILDPFYSPAQLNTIVLRRWYELDPAGAQAELDSVLASPTPSLDAGKLNSLPGEPQPQLEATWAGDLLQTKDNARETLFLALLNRFGTGTAVEQVETKLHSLVGKWACKPQAAALAYLVKFNAGEAGAFIEEAMHSTRDTACYETLFSSISVYASGPALTEAAITALDNADRSTAADAADYLTFFGTEAAKQPLLERYREWSDTYTAMAAGQDRTAESGNAMLTLGSNLGKALLANQAWLADAQLTSEVLNHCVAEEVCEEFHRVVVAAAAPVLQVSAHFVNSENYLIGPYCSKSLDLLEAKLLQFPAGTRFILNIDMSPRTGDQFKLESAIVALFAKRAITLQAPAPKDAVPSLLE